MTSTRETARTEGIRALFGQGAPILWANVGVGAILVATLWSEAPHLQLALWFAALAALTGVRAALQRRYLRAPPGVQEIEVWGRRFVLGTTASGALWGAAGVMFFGDTALSQSLVTFAIGGMTAAAAGTLACHLPAFFAYFVLALGPLTLRTLAEGDRIHLGLSAMLIAYALGMQRVARNNHATFLQAFRLGLKNAELLGQVSESERHLQETNRTLEQRVAERTTALERQSEELRKAQRLEVAGKLAGGLAHDFNSLLTVLLNNAALMKESQQLDEHGKLAADEMLEAARRGAALIRQLLAFSGPKRAQPQIVSLNQLVEDWANLLRHIFSDGITIEVELSAEPVTVRADPVHVEQVLVNLVANARGAMPTGGRLRIATRALGASHDARLPAGDNVQLLVAHAGGTRAELEPRTFAPYFLLDGDTHEPSFGLASARAIVEAWGGRVLVDEAPGPEQETQVRVYIPACAGSVSTPASPPVRAASGSTRATVLVVDDEPTLRSVIRRCLVREGLTVLVAEDGAQALALAASHASPIHLLVTDVVMPGVSGPELARELLVSRPDMAVLFISGYTFEQSIPLAEGSKVTAYLSKPFDTKVLTSRVRALLGA